MHGLEQSFTGEDSCSSRCCGSRVLACAAYLSSTSLQQRLTMKFSIGSFVFALALVHVLVLAACQDSYSCAGSTLCGGLPQSDCDAARRQIQPGNRYFTGGNKGSTGVCSGHCGLFVSGSNCDLTGTEMIDAFNELRARNCAKCGIKTYNDGCKFKADYVTGC